MITYKDIGSGTCADVILDGGLGRCAVQMIGPNRAIRVYEWTKPDFSDWKQVQTVEIPERDMCFPTLGSGNRLAYRIGGQGFLGGLPLGPCGGLFPFAFGGLDDFAARGTGDLTRIYSGGVLTHVEHRKTADGLASLTVAGVPIYRADVRGAERPYGTNPTYSSQLLVCEQEGGAGVRGREGTNIRDLGLRLWPGQSAKVPRIASTGPGGPHYVVTVEPLRIASFEDSDLGPLPTHSLVVPDFKGRAIWAGLYKLQEQGSGGLQYPVFTGLPGNCSPDPHKDLSGQIPRKWFPTLANKPWSGIDVVGFYCEGQGEAWYIALHKQHVAAKKMYPGIPTFGVIDENVKDPMPVDKRLPDVPVYEFYLRGDEGPDEMLHRMESIIARDQHSVVGAVLQMYRGPGSASPEEINECVIRTLQVAYKYPKVRILWGFAANRANGLRDQAVYDAVIPAWKQAVSTMTEPKVVHV